MQLQTFKETYQLQRNKTWQTQNRENVTTKRQKMTINDAAEKKSKEK